MSLMERVREASNKLGLVIPGVTTTVLERGGEPGPEHYGECEKSEKSEKRSGGWPPTGGAGPLGCEKSERSEERSVPQSVTFTGVQRDWFALVSTAADLTMVLQALDAPGPVALDCETTGLNSRADRVRLLSLSTETIDGG